MRIIGAQALDSYANKMVVIPAILLAAALTTATSSDLKTYAACRARAHASQGAGCDWRSGSLIFVNGYYSTRILFRAGHPDRVVIDQPEVPQPYEFAPAEAAKIDMRLGDLSSIDGDYLVCALPPVPSSYDSEDKMDTACLAGAKHLRAGTVAWAFSETPMANQKRKRR